MINVTQPTLIINEKIARSNIKLMADKARINNVSFEPHFKTHQSVEVGEWYREEGVKSITVSSASMALYFANADWEEITIAFPINMLEINTLNAVLAKSALILFVQDHDTIGHLDELTKSVELFIEIDAGYHRSGIGFDANEEIGAIIKSIEQSKHSFKGFYCHAGNSYAAVGKDAIKFIYEDLTSKMALLKSVFEEFNPHIAIGDTPTCSVIDDFSGIDSIHPGNFIYYDYTQVQIGSCKLEQVACYLVCPVVAKNSERKELIIYGGGVHLSKESLKLFGKPFYGLVGRLNERNEFEEYPTSYVKSISQEHGVVATSSDTFSMVKVGDLIAIIPVHSCMAVDCITTIYTQNGEKISKMGT